MDCMAFWLRNTAIFVHFVGVGWMGTKWTLFIFISFYFLICMSVSNTNYEIDILLNSLDQK